MFRLNSLVLLVVARAALACPDSWVATEDGDCYLLLSPDQHTADDAEAACTDVDPAATLAEVHNDQDQLTVRKIV